MRETMRAGVIGHPIGHSKSPLIHNHWLKQYGIDGDYRAYDIAPETLEKALLDLRASGLKGVNVTLPHKRKAMDICTSLSDEARRIGAVNTIVFHTHGEIEGRNTDAYGFLMNAKEACPDFSFAQGPALVLGAGGAARACLYALRREGVADIRISNRTMDNAESLAEEFGARVYDWDEKEQALAGAASLINTTSLGMAGKPPLEIDLETLPGNAVVYDIVYSPLMTGLLQAAEVKGCRIVTGIGMLLHQARPAFQAFFGQEAQVDAELRKAVLA